MSSRYEPRRQAVIAQETRKNGARPGSHRQVRQRGRTGIFALALATTVLVGSAGIGLLPRMQGGTPATTSGEVSASAFESTELANVEAPVVAVKKVSETEIASKVVATRNALPKSSGTGKRVVFSQSKQRVWLVNDNGTIDRSYKVSGSITDNLNAGTYAVESHTRKATSYDYESQMQYFVRFTSGKNAPIGFHDIPMSNAGSLLQTKAQLGTPLSSGCIRQSRPDAIRLWGFAPVGTKVVVLA